MKLKKLLAVLSAVTMSASAGIGSFPAMSFTPVLTASAAENAETTEDGWMYTAGASDVTITGYSGSGTALKIPAEIGGKPVTAIASSAFKGNKTITSIDLGSVTTLGNRIFDGCVSLKSITIPKSVTNVDDDYNRYGALQGSAIETVTFEEGIANIPHHICKNAAYVNKVVMPEKEDVLDGYAIGSNAFEGTALTAVTFPKSLTAINSAAFYNCESLASVAIPDNVTLIGNQCFAKCKRLTELKLGASVKTLGNRIVDGCTSLKEITIPKTVTDVDDDYNRYGALQGSAIETVTFEEGIPNIPHHICKNASNLTKVVMPEKADVLDGYAIGSNAFEGTALSAVTIPKSVTAINSAAFYNCAVLTDVTIPDNVTVVGNQCFANCKRLTGLTLGASVTTLGNRIVDGCASLKEITIPKTVTDVDDDYNRYGALQGSSIETVTFEEGIVNIPHHICKNAAAVTKVVLPDGISQIGSNAFEGTALASVNIPESVTVLNSAAFYNCSALKEFTVPDNVTSIGNQCFALCKQLSALKLGASVQLLGNRILQDSISVKEITIPKSVTNVDDDYNRYGALQGSAIETVTFEEGIANIPHHICKNAEKVSKVILPEKEDVLDGYAIGSNAFEGTSLTSVDIPKSVTAINSAAFYNCAVLTSFVVPDNVQSIGNQCFANCKRLAEFKLGASVESLGNRILEGCASLKEITIPKTVKNVDDDYNRYGALQGSSIETVTFEEGIANIPHHICKNAESVTKVIMPEKADVLDGYVIGSNAFEGTSLTSIDIPNSITSINSAAFYNCAVLTGITIPDNVTGIGNQCFAGCKRLASIQLGSSVENLGNRVFEGCVSLKELTIPKTVKNIDDDYNRYGALQGSSIEVLFIEPGMKTVPEHLAKNDTELRTVYLADTVNTIGDHAFEGCVNLERIVSNRSTFNFSANTFTNCAKLDDSRFTVMDAENTFLTVNSEQTDRNGLANFTLKYKLADSLAESAKNMQLCLSVPEGMTLMLDTIQSKNLEINANKIKDGVIPVDATQGELHFSARVTEYGKYNVSASLKFESNNSKWNQQIGRVSVECPDLTFNAPDTVNEQTAEVFGIAKKGENVDIFVNDKLVTTVTASAATGKYKTAVALPAGKNGTEYELYAACGDLESARLKTVYAAEKPVVTKVMFRYNQHSTSANTLDVTDVFLKGTSPVVTFNPSYSTAFEITATNSDKIEKMFVVSTKGGIQKRLEATYDAKAGIWKAEGFFDNDRSYVPGALNIAIIEKHTKVLDSNYDYEADQKFADLPQAYIDNSSVKVIGETKDAMLAAVNVSDGTEKDSFQLYSGNNSTGTHIDGTYVSAADIAKNPGQYGFISAGVTTVENGSTVTYYTRNVQSSDATADMLLALSDKFSDASDLWEGKTMLKVVDGDTAEATLTNLFFTVGTNQVMKTVLGESYSSIGMGLSLGSDILKYAAQMEMAGGNAEYETAATVLFAVKCFNTLGGTEVLLSAAGIVPPFSTVIAFGIDQVLNSVDGYITDCIRNGEELSLEGYLQYTLSGFIRFIIDPSGIVYEAVPGNRIEGATVTIYYQDAQTGEQVQWNAEDYDQFNPLTTDAEGQYLWDVPEGKWKVIAEKEGYEKYETDWIAIPPVRTDVNLGIISKDAPVLTSASWKLDGVKVQFSKFVDIATVTADAFTVDGYDGKVTVSPLLLDENDKYTDTFMLEGSFTEAIRNVSVKESVKSYAGTAAKASNVPVKDRRYEMGDVNRDGVVNLKDVVVIRRYIAGGWESEMDTALADVNGDGSINLKDAVMIRRYIAGGWGVTFQEAE